MSEDQKKQLQTQLWNIANELRGKMGADEFRDYILGFIFYKYLSEKLTIFANDILEPDNRLYKDLDEKASTDQAMIQSVKKEAIDHLGFFLKPSELFAHVAEYGAKNGNLIEQLEQTLNSIEQSTMGADSEDDFDKLFSELDLNANRLGKTVQARNELIAKVLVHLDKIDFQLENSKIDVLGDAYEYLISQFASGAGKKAGEFYTPQEVSTVLAKIVTDGKKKLKTVYDPTCGSGSLLLRVARQVEEVGMFYGQEMNNTTYNLARMNMILHDVNFSRFDIKQEDTLEHPQHLDQRFEAIVANPPFSANWSASPLHLNEDRFSQYGKLVPPGKADYAFIQHMIYQLDENGTMAIVMPHGVLYRGATEAYIRKFLVKEKNYLDAVIGLPPNLFFGTSIPACILVFKKCRENPDNILFINASKGFTKSKNYNQLKEEDIEKIMNAVRARKYEEKYSYVATFNEIKENDYNLNIARYVDTFEVEPKVDINNVTQELQRLDGLLEQVNVKMLEYDDEIRRKSQSRTVGPESFIDGDIRFKRANGVSYADWKSITLGELGSTYSGLSGKQGDDFGAGLPFITYTQIFASKQIDLDGCGRVRIAPGEKQTKVTQGDIFFTGSSETAAEVGYSSVLLDNPQDTYLNSFCFGYRITDHKMLLPQYAMFLFRGQDFRRSVYRLAQGSTRYNLSKKELMKVHIRLPELAEQQKIADLLSLVDEKIKIENERIRHLALFRKALSQRALREEID